MKVEQVDVLDNLDQVRSQVKKMNDVKNAVAKFISQLDIDPMFQLLGPKPLMTARTYHEKVAMPMVIKLKEILQSTLIRLIEIIQTQQVELRVVKQKAKSRTNNYRAYEEKMNN